MTTYLDPQLLEGGIRTVLEVALGLEKDFQQRYYVLVLLLCPCALGLLVNRTLEKPQTGGDRDVRSTSWICSLIKSQGQESYHL